MSLVMRATRKFMMTQEGSVRIRVGNDGESDGNLIIPGLFLYILFLSRYQDVIVG